MYQVTSYSSADKSEIIRLMGDIPYKEKIWHWQFEENPFSVPFDPIVLKRENEIVGFNGQMAVTVIYDGRPMSALWSCDFYVAAGFRGKGLGKIIKETQIKKCPLIMAFGISNLAAPVLTKMGWRSSDDTFVYRKYRKVDALKKTASMVVQVVNFLKGRFGRGVDPDCRVHLSESLPERDDVERLWQDVGHSYAKIVVRDFNYLHWRYEKHPLARYRFAHVLCQDRLVAVGVFRGHKSHAMLVDMLVHSQDISSRKALVGAMQQLYPECSQYACVTTDKLLAKCLLNEGFFRGREKPRFFVRSDFEGDDRCAQHWFIITGDSDGELLQAAADNYESSVKTS